MSSRIEIDSFMLADAAKAFDGKLYVHGGGWNFLDILEQGTARPMTVVGRVIIPWDEEEREITLEIHLEHREQSTILQRVPVLQIQMKTEAHPRIAQPKAVETATPFAFDIPGVIFYASGEYAFVISQNGEELARTRFQVNILEDALPNEASTRSQNESLI